MLRLWRQAWGRPAVHSASRQDPQLRRRVRAPAMRFPMPDHAILRPISAARKRHRNGSAAFGMPRHPSRRAGSTPEMPSPDRVHLWRAQSCQKQPSRTARHWQGPQPAPAGSARRGHCDTHPMQWCRASVRHPPPLRFPAPAYS